MPELDNEWEEAIGDFDEDNGLTPDREAIDNEEENDDTNSDDNADDTTDDAAGDNGASDDDATGDDKTEKEDADKDADKNGEAADGAKSDDTKHDDAGDATGEDKPEDEDKPQTRDEIKAALREVEWEKETRQSDLTKLKEEVLSGLYPEGIDRQLRDNDGDPINGLQDLTGVDPQTGKQVGAGLINPLTDAVFTEDEAGRYIMRGQQRLNEQVQLMEDQAYKIAETQLTLKESSDRVEEKFGAILDKLPEEMTKRIADAYIATLRKDPKSGMVIEAPLDAFEFYQIALAGAEKLAASAPPTTPPPDTKPEPSAKPPADKSDRADLGRKGVPEKRSEDDKEWDEAYNEVLGA